MFREKLIRDNIVTGANFAGKFRIANDTELPSLLINKLNEEVAEAIHEMQHQSRDALVEELADVLEVVRAIAGHYDICLSELQNVTQQKRDKRGGFEQRIVLTEPSNK